MLSAVKRESVSRAVRCLLLSATVALLAPGDAVAQSTSVGVRTTPVDTVQGVVFDSLSGMPVGGAFVSADGGEVSATTDSAGRFLLLSASRIARIVVYHELLDRVGLGALRAERGDVSGRWAPRLATPSIESVWARFCSGRRPRNGLGGIVFGRTMAADGSTRLGGAQVELQWETTELRADTMPRYKTRVVRSDSAGDYVVCGVQEFGPAGVIAVAPTVRSAALLLPGDVVPIRRANLMLGTTDIASRTSVQGTVQDAEGQPVSDAMITIDGVESSARSGADGRFRVAGVPTGTRMLSVRKVGILPYLAPIDVLTRGVAAYTVMVERGVTIEGVRITARRSVSRDRREFEERARAGIGKVMDSTTIMQFPRLQSALRQYPALQVATANNGIDFTLLGRFGSGGVRCRAYIYVDGVVESSAYLAVLPPENIAAMELFNSDALAPVRFRPLGNSCAVLLVWTKNFLRG